MKKFEYTELRDNMGSIPEIVSQYHFDIKTLLDDADLGYYIEQTRYNCGKFPESVAILNDWVMYLQESISTWESLYNLSKPIMLSKDFIKSLRLSPHETTAILQLFDTEDSSVWCEAFLCLHRVFRRKCRIYTSRGKMTEDRLRCEGCYVVIQLFEAGLYIFHDTTLDDIRAELNQPPFVPNREYKRIFDIIKSIKKPAKEIAHISIGAPIFKYYSYKEA